MTTPADAVPTTTTAPAAAAPASPLSAPATVGHIRNLHVHLDDIKSWVAQKFSELAALVEKAAPVVAEVGPVLAAAVPGVAPVVAVVEEAASVVACCVHGIESHFINGVCAVPGCSCKVKPAA
jgi:phage-related minor tail protein